MTLLTARDWVSRAIPYCQCAGGPASECCGTCFACSQTRCDCSGFVSYCWGLRTGYTTFSLPSISHQIRKDQLLPGDIMLDVSDHVTFFAGWTDGSKTNYVAIQEPGCHTEGPHHAFASTVPYPFKLSTFRNVHGFFDTSRDAAGTRPRSVRVEMLCISLCLTRARFHAVPYRYNNVA